ncbi:MAG: hypothetical protein EBR46_08280 [Betaproteobacteria bacterium]|nr:hypothetical protein [Betaproteobacteria bacterium]
MDAVQQANSGHPGAPMGMAEMAVALWGRHLRHNPQNPHWANRDRFVLSNGHGSMLIYALLHLTGYALPMDELRNFRQMHSKTPGHPEVGITPGVETTTGPLGQGVTNAVGMALAEKLLAAEFNRPGHTIVDHHTYVFLGDGCLMEGISHEACALAGAWKLDKLIALYDDNGISIDGKVAPWFVDNTAQRFEAYGWNVIGPVDGHDTDAVDKAIAQAKQANGGKPSLIICKTSIGKGSPNRANTAKAHGEPLGGEEIKLTREALGWPHEPFVIPQEAYDGWNAHRCGAEAEAMWNARFSAYAKAHPAEAAEFARRMAGDLPANFAEIAEALVGDVHDKAETVASRKASQMALEHFTARLPEMLGGSADLTGSNLTQTKATPALRVDAQSGAVVKTTLGEGPAAREVVGRHINYGVREFGMAAIMNGVALHRPSALLLSRQNLPYAPKNQADLITRGAYVLAEPEEVGLKKKPQAVIIATGSEVQLALHAQTELARLKIAVRVVSMPSTTVFDRQDAAYKAEVLPAGLPRVAIEAGVTDFWWKYGCAAVLGIDSYGESAPAGVLFKHFHFTTENLVATVRKVLGR